VPDKGLTVVEVAYMLGYEDQNFFPGVSARGEELTPSLIQQLLS